LHDAIIGERLGLPSVGVMTAHFVSAADLMARVLGADGYRFVVIPHPMSSATVAELQTNAHQAVNDSRAILLGAKGGGSLLLEPNSRSE
jgi:hypothetical protein